MAIPLKIVHNAIRYVIRFLFVLLVSCPLSAGVCSQEPVLKSSAVQNQVYGNDDSGFLVSGNTRWSWHPKCCPLVKQKLHRMLWITNVILEIMPKQVLLRKITGFKILCKPSEFASHRCVCNTHRMSQSEKKKGQAASWCYTNLQVTHAHDVYIGMTFRTFQSMNPFIYSVVWQLH